MKTNRKKALQQRNKCVLNYFNIQTLHIRPILAPMERTEDGSADSGHCASEEDGQNLCKSEHVK